MNHRPVQKLEPARAAGFSDHDLGDVLHEQQVEFEERQVRLDGKVDLEALEQPLRPLQRGADKLGNIGRFARQFDSARFKPRHIEEVADEAGHASAFLLDGLGKFKAALGVQFLAVVAKRCRSAEEFEASGVFKSCERDVSRAPRSRSASAVTRASSISLASRTRSIATAA